MAPKTKEKKRFFVLLDENNKDTETVYSTKLNPSLAARKAARAGHVDIRLREHGTKKVRQFKGSVKTVPRPPNAPDWLPQNPKVGITKYVGIYFIDREGNRIDKPKGTTVKKKAAPKGLKKSRGKENKGPRKAGTEKPPSTPTPPEPPSTAEPPRKDENEAVAADISTV